MRLLRNLPRGFTLVELLVVITVIALLAGLLFPALKSARSKGTLTKCANNLRQISLALEMYANTYDDEYPMAVGAVHWDDEDPDSHVAPWSQRLLPYSKDVRLYECPGQPVYMKNNFSYFLGTRAALVATGGRASVSRKAIQLPAQYIMAGDSTFFEWDLADADKDNYSQDCLFTSAQDRQNIVRYHSGRVNVLFADGHVKSFNEFTDGEMTYAYDRPGVNWDAF
jgi:prepilin-type processing-associated H-X9-DG protein/prepilin-type N-terminal cleavage/methylation domain-containing protein